MLRLRGIWLFCLLATLLSAGLVSCERKDAPGPNVKDDGGEVLLAMRVGTISQTKADVSAIAEMKSTAASFRGLDKVYVIPFSGSDILPGSEPLSLPLELPGFLPAGDYNANAHLYRMHQAIAKGTERVLAYGKGLTQEQSTEVKTKQIYGSLIESGRNSATAEGFRFSPEPMYASTTDRPQEALAIAKALTTVVNGSSYTVTAYYGNEGKSKDVTIVWSGNLRDNNLSDCYQQLTAEGHLLPGSGAGVSVLLTTLYKALRLESIDEVQYQLDIDGITYDATKKVDNVESPLLYKDLFNGLRQAILHKMIELSEGDKPVLDIDPTAKTVVFHDSGVQGYPENLGLPSGAATVRWSPTGYVVPLQNGLDGIAALSDYCFPPALYYRANTSVKTSNDELDETAETAINQSTDWLGVLSTYYLSGAKVTNLTASMALEDPLNFAVGMLAATVQADKEDLLDNNYHTQVHLTDGLFPLTGIIIGRQYPQYFDFTPVYDPSASPEPRQYYLYDNQISGISLTATKSSEFRTLVLQTPKEKSVYVCLEFLNNSSNITFYGIDEGRIMPGHHFYLVGLLEVPSEKQKDENGNDLDSVFIQDRITSVNFTIKSLENAYSAIPDMGIPQLSIGVLAQLNWEMATPTEIWLD